MSERLSRRNAVRGTGGRWIYGLMTRDSTGSLSFDVVRPSVGGEGRYASISLSGLSPYRTTSLARRMKDDRCGYETEARRAIREFEERES